MATWHQLKAGIPYLVHDKYWTCYNTMGHLSVMRFDKREDAEIYAKKTGHSIIPPRNTLAAKESR